MKRFITISGESDYWIEKKELRSSETQANEERKEEGKPTNKMKRCDFGLYLITICCKMSWQKRPHPEREKEREGERVRMPKRKEWIKGPAVVAVVRFTLERFG